MNSGEFMIGDFVTLSKARWTEQRAVSLMDIEMVAEGIYTAEPIPLTKEILEKNGFIRYGTNYVLMGNNFSLENPSSPDNYKDNYWVRISMANVKVEYVHELQHLLRVGHIRKEIEL